MLRAGRGGLRLSLSNRANTLGNPFCSVTVSRDTIEVLSHHLDSLLWVAPPLDEQVENFVFELVGCHRSVSLFAVAFD